jgi:uncharacterized protein (TIGR01777 family)
VKILVSGASGFIGSALSKKLVSSGHRVISLTRQPVSAGQDAVNWDPAEGRLEERDLVGIDAVVHLASESIGDHRWTESRKARVLDSKVRGTHLLAKTIAGLDAPPKVMVSQSGTHYYGFESGEQELTEESPPGTGFLATVSDQSEAVTEPAVEAGIRVVRTRSGAVLHPSGLALQRSLPFFKLGLGGKVGSGRQYLSWISLRDWIAAAEFLLERKEIAGPVNVTSPNPVTNAEFTHALGSALGRPTFMPVPSLAIKLLFGAELAEEMIFGSQRVIPKRLQDAGFEFTDPELGVALQTMLS